MLSSDRRASWFPLALSSPECALAAGGRAICCFAYFLSLLLVDLDNCCRNLYGFNAVFLFHGRFWNGFTSAASASL